MQIFRKSASSPSSHQLESERPFIFDIFRLDRFVPVPEIKNGGDHDANPQAAEKEPAVGGKPDQQDEYQRRSDDQTCCRRADSFCEFGLRIPFHTNTLPVILSDEPQGSVFRDLCGLCVSAVKSFYRKGRKGNAKDAKNIPDNRKGPLARAFRDADVETY